VAPISTIWSSTVSVFGVVPPLMAETGPTIRAETHAARLGRHRPAVDSRALDLDVHAELELVPVVRLAVVVEDLRRAVVEADAVDDDRAEARDRALS
jgi:hypothetical protein